MWGLTPFSKTVILYEMLAIKLQRVGRKHQPSYRVVVAEKRSKLGGPPVEQIGSYDPSTKEASIDKNRTDYWLLVGAKPTASIHNLLVKQGIISGPKIAIKIKRKEAEPAVGNIKSVPAENGGDIQAEKQTEKVEQAGAELKTEPVKENGEKQSAEEPPAEEPDTAKELAGEEKEEEQTTA